MNRRFNKHSNGTNKSMGNSTGKSNFFCSFQKQLFRIFSLKGEKKMQKDYYHQAIKFAYKIYYQINAKAHKDNQQIMLPQLEEKKLKNLSSKVSIIQQLSNPKNYEELVTNISDIINFQVQEIKIYEDQFDKSIKQVINKISKRSQINYNREKKKNLFNQYITELQLAVSNYYKAITPMNQVCVKQIFLQLQQKLKINLKYFFAVSENLVQGQKVLREKTSSSTLNQQKLVTQGKSQEYLNGEKWKINNGIITIQNGNKVLIQQYQLDQIKSEHQEAKKTLTQIQKQISTRPTLNKKQKDNFEILTMIKGKNEKKIQRNLQDELELPKKQINKNQTNEVNFLLRFVQKFEKYIHFCFQKISKDLEKSVKLMVQDDFDCRNQSSDQNNQQLPSFLHFQQQFLEHENSFTQQQLKLIKTINNKFQLELSEIQNNLLINLKSIIKNQKQKQKSQTQQIQYYLLQLKAKDNAIACYQEKLLEKQEIFQKELIRLKQNEEIYLQQMKQLTIMLDQFPSIYQSKFHHYQILQQQFTQLTNKLQNSYLEIQSLKKKNQYLEETIQNYLNQLSSTITNINLNLVQKESQQKESYQSSRSDKQY